MHLNAFREEVSRLDFEEDILLMLQASRVVGVVVP